MRYTESQLSSDLLDMPFHAGEPVKLVIASPPRTGSYMLCRMMLHAGLGVPHEYFNEYHIRTIASRFGIPGANEPIRMPEEVMRRYLRALFERRTRHGLFAVKLQHKQVRLFLPNPLARSLLDGARLIYLTRQNLLAQAVSLHFAELTGRWSFEEDIITRPKQEQNFFDAAAIGNALIDIMVEQALWEELFLEYGIQPLRITYESLRNDPAGTLRRIASLAGVPADSLDLDYDDDGPYETDTAQPAKPEVMERFRAAWRATRCDGARLTDEIVRVARRAELRPALAETFQKQLRAAGL